MRGKSQEKRTPQRKPAAGRRRPTAPRQVSRRLILGGLLAATLVVSCLAGILGLKFLGPGKPSTSGFRIVNRFPHDPDAFTQGFLFDGGVLYESTGREGKSSVRRVALETGEALASHSLSAEMFGEGLTLWQDRLVQLTWRNGVGFVYDKADLRQVGEFRYDGEGWGLTHDGRNPIMSDGTSKLRFLDPATFKTVRTLTVQDQGRPVPFLNELEFVKGEIFANVWQSDRIARISPKTGRVTGWIDLTGLLDAEWGRPSATDVLNGIAWDKERDRLFVTGKLWPWIYEIELTP